MQAAARRVHRRSRPRRRRRSTRSTSSRTACSKRARRHRSRASSRTTSATRRCSTSWRRRSRSSRSSLPNVVDDVNFVARDEDGPLHRRATWRSTRGLREIPAAVHDAPESCRLPRQRLAASARPGRLHGLPRGHGPVGELPRRVAYAEQRRSSTRSGKRSTTGKSRTCGTTRCCRRNMTEASCAKCHKQEVYVPKRREAERRVRDVRARRLLRVPQDQGLREPAEARADPDEDRLEADAGLGEELDPRSEARSSRPPGCRGSGTTRTAARRRTRPQRGRDQRGRGVSVREQRRRYEPAVANPPRGDAKRGEQIVTVDRLPGLPRHRRERSRRSRSAPHVRPAARRTSATRRPTSGSTTGCAIRSTTTPAPTCPTCASPTRRSPTWRRI